ncbi:serine/threonine protein kinase [Cladophialophora yegresii CBS 114405]|uniref:Serine/threonine protein kinase n=1 Tax=Cladophialophora yegresii CBS 114405 TaxID=1182544 RepID=W9VZT5_9EURO|nr:serine/threonine protein kinase [Cladophialophora yegresii CBS 114405]EXJ58240.1 serine/threonine protein kinase [Cladophialophora yegresii CBS 114405]
MTSVTPGPDPIHEFMQQLEKWKVTAVCGRQYIQVQNLKRWMLEGRVDGQPTKVDRLLFACCRSKNSFSLLSDKITEGPWKCLLVFSILLELGNGALIEDLRSPEVNDDRLPVPLAVLERRTVFARYPELLRRFEKAQWKYCPLTFEPNERQSLTADHIVPICRKKKINEGGTARIYEIVVQEEFVTEALAKAVPRSRFVDEDYGLCHIFALKTYKNGNEELYENERNAFRGLSTNRGMIKYLLDYSQVGGRPSANDSANQTFHLVLELGELDLDQYFHFYLPPVLVEEQLHFWSHVFLVADTIRDIHAFYHAGNLGPEKYYGWHNDVKPQNILYVQGVFKLADPGFARFEKQDIESRDATDYMGGTSTFGAPECYILEHQKRWGKRSSLIPRSSDIWSLGCVLSVAATWSVYGTSGLEQFAELRRQAIKHIIDNKAVPEQSEVPLEAGDFFHDGQRALEAVSLWHSFLRQGLRKSDRFTEKVLDFIENAMLVSNPALRISAQKLCEELYKIKESATGFLGDAVVADCIRDAIQTTQLRWEEGLVEASQSRAKESKASMPSRNSVELRAQSPAGARVPTSQLPQTRVSHRSRAVGHNLQSFIITSRGLMPGTAHDDSLTTRDASPHRSSMAGHLDVVQEEERYSQPHEDISLAQSSVLLTPPQRAFTTTSTRSRSSTLSTKMKFWRKETPRGDPELRHYFEDRDILFLVDNGASMAEHWGHVKIKLIQLVEHAGNIDKDGMDLMFTASSTGFKPTNKVVSFQKELDNEKHTPKQRAETNMSVVLGSILNKYLETVAQWKKSMPRKMTIIVLTDGKWKDMKNSFAVDDKIVEFSEHLKKLRPNTLEEDERRLSIQFVQFGNDAQATHRLTRLDDHLLYRGVPDIVDHKRAHAEPFDIFAGSVSPAADGYAADEVSPGMTTSPEGMEVYDERGNSSLGSPRRHSRSTGNGFQMPRQPSALVLPVSVEQSQPTPPRHPRSSESRQSSNSQDPARPWPPAFNFIGH